MVQRICAVSLAVVFLVGCASTPTVPPVTTVVNTVEYIPVPPECLVDYEVAVGEIQTNGDLLIAYKALEQQVAHYRTRLQCVRDSQKPKAAKNKEDAK